MQGHQRLRQLRIAKPGEGAALDQAGVEHMPQHVNQQQFGQTIERLLAPAVAAEGFVEQQARDAVQGRRRGEVDHQRRGQ